MNIFYLDEDVKECAIAHCDKHVVKMILETCQMLCTAHYKCESEFDMPMKATHVNHPCNLWLVESINNYNWLCDLGLELCKEYTYRFGKVHKCQHFIEYLNENPPDLEDISMTKHAQAMPDQYKSDDPLDSYRQYYFFEKNHILKWTKRSEPKWITEIRQLFE